MTLNRKEFIGEGRGLPGWGTSTQRLRKGSTPGPSTGGRALGFKPLLCALLAEYSLSEPIASIKTNRDNFYLLGARGG